MELEVSQKVRAAIKAKLIEVGIHADDELPDYVMVLIANRRTASQMEADLNLFLGDQTSRFVNWLSMVLKKLEEVTAAAASTSTTTKQSAKKRKSSTSAPDNESPTKKQDPKPEPEVPEPTKKKKRDKVEKQDSPKPEKLSKKKEHHKQKDPEPEKLPEKRNEPEKVEQEPDNREETPPPPKKASPRKTRISTPPRYKPPHRSKSREEVAKHSEDDNLQSMRDSLLKSKPKPRQISPIRRSRSKSRSRSPQQRRSPHRRRSRSPPTSPRKHPLARYPPRATSSRSRSPVSLQRHEHYKARSSVFERLLNRRRNVSPPPERHHRHSVNRRSRSRSKSSSPPRKLLSSVVVKKKIESIIKSNDPPKVASAVVKVEVPKARGVVEKPSKLLLKAVSEANADAFKSSGGGKGRELEKKVERKLEGERVEEAPRRSIRDRLGKRVVTSIQERLGSGVRGRGNERFFHENITVTVEGNSEEYNPEDYVETYNPEENSSSRFHENEDSGGDVFDPSLSPASLALVDSDVVIPRISIAVNDDDTSDEEEDDESEKLHESKEDEKEEQSTSPQESPQQQQKEDEDDEDAIVLQQNSPLNLETEETEKEVPEEKPQASDLREKLVKRHNAKKIQEKEEAAAAQLPPQEPQKTDSSQPKSSQPSTPPTVVINPTIQKPHPPPIMISPNPPPLIIQPQKIICKYGNACTFRAAGTCKFEHPPTKPIFCKFDLLCKNPQCTYKHSRKPIISSFSGKIPKPSAGQCHFYPKCTNLDCKFYHPPSCKFGSLCTNKFCKYYHEGREGGAGMLGGKFVVPGANLLPQRALLKWQKK